MTDTSYTKLEATGIADTLFHPENTAEPRPPEHSENITITLDDPTASLGCRLYCDKEISSLIVLFHGAREKVGDYDLVASHFLQHQIALLVVTIRGYGWSRGEPTITNYFSDLPAIHNAVSKLIAGRFNEIPVFVMGRSLGSMRAIETIQLYPESYRGMILESSFAETRAFFQNLGCNLQEHELSEDDFFQPVDKVSNIEKPTLILHGSRDQLVSIREAEKLQSFSGAKTKQFHIIPGAEHDNLMSVGDELYFETIKKFIDTVTGANTWRYRRKKFKKDKP